MGEGDIIRFNHDKGWDDRLTHTESQRQQEMPKIGRGYAGPEENT